jgi:hypothetical protein
MTAPNIFKPRNDWNVISFRCKKLPLGIIARIRLIIKEVTGFDPYIKIRSRKGEFVRSRQFFCYFVKNHTNLNLTAIGNLIGGKDHSTVIHAIKCVNKFKEHETDYKIYYNMIEEKINLS